MRQPGTTLLHLKGLQGAVLQGNCSILVYRLASGRGRGSDLGGSKHWEPVAFILSELELLAICFQLSSFLVDLLLLLKFCF